MSDVRLQWWPPMTGAEISERIGEIAAAAHVINVHFPDSRRAKGVGWPDHFLMGTRGILYREVKGRADQLSGVQRAFGYALQANQQDWKVWTEHDLATGQIEREIEAIA